MDLSYIGVCKILISYSVDCHIISYGIRAILALNHASFLHWSLSFLRRSWLEFHLLCPSIQPFITPILEPSTPTPHASDSSHSTTVLVTEASVALTIEGVCTANNNVYLI